MYGKIHLTLADRRVTRESCGEKGGNRTGPLCWCVSRPFPLKFRIRFATQLSQTFQKRENFHKSTKRLGLFRAGVKLLEVRV